MNTHTQPHEKVYDRMLQQDLQEGSPQRPLLKLEIELQNGSKVYISPQPCDEPVRLATEFCEEHNLDSDMIDILAESIKKSISHPMPQEVYPKDKKFSSHSCKTSGNTKSPQYFSKKFSVNSSLGLYQKGMMLQDAKKHWIARQNEKKTLEQMRECTHKPKINKLSRSLISERERSKMNEDRSADKFQQNQLSKNLPSLRSSILIESRPSPTPLTQQKHDSNITSSSNSVFLKLYEHRTDGISRSKVLSEMLREQTHHPVINDISKEIVGNANFKQRLDRYQREKMNKNSKLKRMQQQEKENLYKPKTGPPPQNRNIQGLPIGDFLYSKKKKPMVVKMEIQQPKINETSKMIYQKRKMAAFNRIFQHLAIGSGSNRRVDWRMLDPNKIDAQLLPIITPLMEQIEMMQIQLCLQDFKTALNFLFNTLSPTDKGILLNFRPSPKDSHPQSKPQTTIPINKRSQQIARSIGRSRLSIYDYCEIKQSMRLQRMQQQRVQKQRRQMKECTFQPKIQRRSIYY